MSGMIPSQPQEQDEKECRQHQAAQLKDEAGKKGASPAAGPSPLPTLSTSGQHPRRNGCGHTAKEESEQPQLDSSSHAGRWTGRSAARISLGRASEIPNTAVMANPTANTMAPRTNAQTGRRRLGEGRFSFTSAPRAVGSFVGTPV